MDNRPIGFLDSGVGGLTVVRELMRQLPNEAIVYIGDSLRAPYGPRPDEEIRQFTWEMVDFLKAQNVKMIVMACNTATAVALDEVKEILDIPVLGVILPGSSAAIQKTKTKEVAVIGTQATIHSGSYVRTIHAKSPSVHVTSLACPAFVPLVETGNMDTPDAQRTVEEALSPLVGKVDTLILGCTHYPLLRTQIQQAMGEDVTLIDSGAETARDISVLLNYFRINGHERDDLWHDFYTTGDPATFTRIANAWLDTPISVKHVDLTLTTPKPVLLIATRNPGKAREFAALFTDYTIETLLDYPDLPDIAETGTTFEENARLKAEKISELTGRLTIGDDSGLCVDILGGLPGVWSHRFAGPDPTDMENNAKLLHELASTELMPEKRCAHFHTTLVASRKGKDSLVVEADWHGSIALSPQGDNGFGYDPLFLPDDTPGKSAAELTPDEKNRLSHRGQALQKLMKELPHWLQS
ncbi:MAG: glutamate racemase [Streptococcaceae bacterium]|jgi:glutamate racemase|nr:glutamate racemase [Streptococcaceae bacterium]